MRTVDPVKKDQIREDILRAAMSLFQKYGIDKTTMEDIAENAGKGKSTLYYYFKTKEDVFFAAAIRERDKMQRLVENGLREAKTAEEKLKLFFSIQDNSLKTKVKLYPIIFKETKKHIVLFHRLQRMNNTWEVQLFKSILHDGIASGEFRSIRREDCDIIALTAITFLHVAQLNLLLEGKVPSSGDRTMVMLDVFVRGLK